MSARAPQETVAIIGAGAAGLVAARWLTGLGLGVRLFEQGDALGGQWRGADDSSGIWPQLTTNTSREMTCFSDQAFEEGTPLFPAAREVQRYLETYARSFGLDGMIRFGHRLERLRREDDAWSLDFATGGGSRSARFNRVVLANGRFSKPYVPAVPGMEAAQQRGSLRIMHSQAYRGVEPLRKLRVLVAGSAISALEIASELAMAGTVEVTNCLRKQRYVIRKLFEGVPTDHLNYSAVEALAAERLPGDTVAADLKNFVLKTAGSPEQYGAPRPHDDLRVAGVTKCEDYLDCVQSGAIKVRPWIREVRGRQVVFEDGTEASFDVLIFGTGYGFDLPFLDAASKNVLATDQPHMQLWRHTLHPEFPGLAFLGYYNAIGPYFPVLELQARWIAGMFSGQCPVPDEPALRVALAAQRENGPLAERYPMHHLVLLFARALGVLPRPQNWPGLHRQLLFGPLCSNLFRLEGPHASDAAPARVREAARMSGIMDDTEFTREERLRLKQIQIDPRHPELPS